MRSSGSRVRVLVALALSSLAHTGCGRIGFPARDASDERGADAVSSDAARVDEAIDAPALDAPALDGAALDIATLDTLEAALFDAPGDAGDLAVALDGADAGSSADDRGAEVETDAPDAAPVEASADASIDVPADTTADTAVADAPADAPADTPADAPADAPPACISPQVLCAGSCVTLGTSASHCGACGRACGAAEVCAASSCTLPAPRLIAPLTPSVLRRRRPTLRWALAAGVTGARVEVCADRPCTRVEAIIDAEGTSGSPSTPLGEGVHFWRAYGRNGALVGAQRSPTWEFFLRGPDAPTDAPQGYVNDMNGDGLADCAFGVPSTNLATVQVVLSDGGMPAAARAMPTPLAGRYLMGGTLVTAGASFGRVVAFVADMNGDGFGDLAVSAPQDLAGCGVVFVFFGGPGGDATLFANAVVFCASAGEAQGEALATAGDFDNDGYGDLLIGAPGFTGAVTREGRVRILHGAPRPEEWVQAAFRNPTPAANEAFGAALAGGGDFDGDGLTDVLMGEPGDAAGRGAVHLVRGVRARFTAVIDDTYAGDATGDFAGLALALQGDVDGDGRSDALLGLPGASGASGAVRLILGNAGSTSGAPRWLTGSAAVVATVARLPGVTGGFGSSVAYLGDVDGDGDTELVASALAPNGVLALANGGPATRATAAVATDFGLPTGFRASPYVLAGPGDLTGDGRPDVLFGLPAIDEIFAFPGVVGGGGATFGTFSVLHFVSSMAAAQDLGVSVASREAPLRAAHSRAFTQAKWHEARGGPRVGPR